MIEMKLMVGRKLEGEDNLQTRTVVIETTTFFVSNIQDGTTKGNLTTTFQIFGKIGDVYTAQKRDNKGANFAFVRFRGIENTSELEKSMNGITCGPNQIKVNIA